MKKKEGRGTQAVCATSAVVIAATVSPNHSQLISELQRVLWSIPITGGTATRLTEEFLEPSRPAWSSQGDSVVFQAFKAGTFHVWTMNSDGTGVRRLTEGHYDDREPRYSPGGQQIAFSSDRGLSAEGTRSYDIWVLYVACGNLTQLTNSRAEEFEPAWSPDGSAIAFVNGNA